MGTSELLGSYSTMYLSGISQPASPSIHLGVFLEVTAFKGRVQLCADAFSALFSPLSSGSLSFPVGEVMEKGVWCTSLMPL